MPVIKQYQDKSVNIPNEVAQDLEMSVEALGALTRLCSYSNNYEFKVEWLQKSWKKGRDAIRNILRELRNKGFLKFVAIRNAKNTGFDGQEWHISNRPIFDIQSYGKPVALPVLRETSATEIPQDNKKEEIDKKKESSSSSICADAQTDALTDDLSNKTSEAEGESASEEKSPHTKAPAAEKLFVKSKRQPDSKLTDREFLDKIKLSYKFIDVEFERNKAQRWCEINSRRNTRQFFIKSWLTNLNDDGSYKRVPLAGQVLTIPTENKPADTENKTLSENQMWQDGELLTKREDGLWYNQNNRVVFVARKETFMQKFLREQQQNK